MTVAWNRTRGILHSPRPVEVARFVDLDGIGTWDFVHFQAEIWQLRESECRIVLTHSSGEEVKKDGSYNDFYGFLTSVRDPIQAFPEWSRRYATPDLSVEVRLTVTDTPCLHKAAEQAGDAPQYFPVPRDWMEADAEIEADRKLPWNERKDLQGKFFGSSIILDDILISSAWRDLPAQQRMARGHSVIETACADVEANDARQKAIDEIQGLLQPA